MSDNKKYYYLKLKDNFFDSDELVMLESMPDGYMYSNILLKLYLKSLKNNGRLMFNDRIPYNSTMLASITRHPVAVVEKAVQQFLDLGLIEILNNGAIYILDIQNFIGSSSSEADRKRAYRLAIDNEKNNMLPKPKDKCPDKNPPEKEIEIEKDIELDTEIKKKTKKPTAFDGYTENSLLSDAIKDFISMRKQIKAPMTDRAIKLMLQKLDTLATDDETKIAILNQSILNSWKGIFSLKDKQQTCNTNRPFNSNTGNRAMDAAAAAIAMLQRQGEQDGQ